MKPIVDNDDVSITGAASGVNFSTVRAKLTY
jgi:hypothetical protein